MFALHFEEIFKITGRGYVLSGTLQDPSDTVKVGDYLKINKEERAIQVKGAIPVMN